MRALRVLLVGFGFLLGLLIAGIGLVVDWLAGPFRTNFAYVEGDSYGTLVAIAVDQPSLYFPIVLPLFGALLGWLAAILVARRGWQLARGGSGTEMRGDLER